ncbi:BA14K family protein [Bradyrhizobium neotropicale]|uniref:BA14K family protein n=1 Tax=Bradyrhizobium neotropicale TaxID=1497615 RepID=UPI001AD67A8A|nr:BA14K family protein [Bradyrhizobium neotropicale]MBO4225946.1 BA14K family protein [Bradyrhizobium neotropicale]
MGRLKIAIWATILAAPTISPGSATEFGYRAIRYGQTSGWFYDNRNDNRDFPTNGVFPGNFAAQPAVAWIGAAGFLGSMPQRSASPYPSQVVFGPASRSRRSAPKK